MNKIKKEIYGEIEVVKERPKERFSVVWFLDKKLKLHTRRRDKKKI